MADLSQLTFKVDSSELERAQKVIKDLGNDFAKFDKTMQSSARLQAQTEALLARAAKDQAKARQDNAKAADQELKSTIAADKADQAREKSIKKVTKATEDSAVATTKLDALIYKVTETTGGMASGLSKSQAQLIATAKAMGATNDQLEILKSNTLAQKKLSGGDPFDKSNSGAVSLRNSLTELNAANRLYAAGLDLTSKQARELARDQLRLLESAKANQQSIFSTRDALREQQQEYAKLASQYNKQKASEDALIKSRTDAANATKYVTLEDQKMNASLSATNASLDKAASDKLVKYEQALRQMGLSQDVVTAKLGTYRKQVEQTLITEQKRKENNLARAASSQLTDIGVSLYSGQNPLTVMIQQSGQLADQLRLSGVEADQFAKVLKNSFYSMIPVIKSVGVGLLELTAGVLMDFGKGAVKTIADFIGMSFAVEKLKQALASGGEQNFKYIGTINKIGNALSVLATVGIVAVTTALIAMGIEWKKILETESDLSKALATSGGAMGLSKDQAIAYAESMKGIGVGTLKAMEGITEFTKVGKIGKEGLDLLIKSAIDLEKYAGIPIEETAKKFAKFQDEPTKALTEFAETSGLVTKAVLNNVAALEQQGDKTAAVEAATNALRIANNQMVEEIKANLSPIETLWNEIKSAIGGAKQELYEITTAEANVKALTTVFQTLAVIASEVWFTFKGVGKEIGGIAAQIASMDISAVDFATPGMLAAKIAKGFFSDNAQSIRKDMISTAELDRKNHDAQIARIMNLGETQKKNFSDSKEMNSQFAAWRKDNAQALLKEDSKEERYAQKKKQIQSDVVAGIITETEALKVLEGWKRIIMGDKKPKADKQPLKDLETEIDLRNKSLGLLGTFNNELEAIERRRAKTGDEDQYQKSLNDLIKKQPVYIARQKEMNQYQDLYNKLLGKSEDLGADYYKQLELIDEAVKSGFDPAKIDEMRKALEATTPAARKLAAELEAFERSKAGTEKGIRSWMQDIAKLGAENAGLRISLSEDSLDRQKLITAEGEKQLDIYLAQRKLEEKKASIDEGVRKGTYDPEQAKKDIERYSKLATENVAKIAENANLKLMADYAKEIDSAASGAANALGALGNNSFANAISGLNNMVLGIDKLISRQEVFDKMRKDAGGDAEQITRINKMQAQSQLKSYGDITGAMKGFFKEGSKGYKALNTAEKVFRAFEMAMALKSAATRITAEASVTTAKVAGTQAASAATASSSLIEIAWTKAVNIVKGIGAILTQGSGDPYTAIPRMAAMAAIVAGLGIAIGGIAGGGGSSVQPSNQGTGTVFGDKEAKSESIKNSLGLLEDINTLTMQYSAEMAKSLRSIETSLTGVTNVILRSSGIENSARGIQTGTTPSGFGSALMKLMDLPGLDPLLGKIINALFGTKTTITGQGVMAQDATIEQIQNGGLQAGYYTDINKKKKFLGITTSDKNSTQFDESNELSRQFAGIINGFVDVVKSAAPILGVSLEQIDASLAGFIVKIGKIDLKDLKGDEIKEKLMAVFGAAGDDIAMQTLKGFEKYQEAGEGYLETITRVATTVEQARGQMDSLNSTMLLTVDGAMELVDAFGGLESFLQTTSSYLNAYFTDEERKATIARQGSAALKTKGIDISPDQLSKLNYLDVRGWVTSLEKGDKELYAWAQNLAVQLSPLYELPSEVSKEREPKEDNSAEDAAKKALDLQRQKLDLEKQLATLSGDDNALRQATLGIRALELNAMDESLRAIQLSIWAYEDQKAALDKLVAANKALNDSMTRDVNNAQKASDKAMAALERAVSAERKKAEEAEKAAEEIKDNLEGIFELLKDSVRELFLEVDSTKKMLASQGRDLIRGAIASGILPDEKTLGDAIGAVRDNLESTQYATKYESDRARLGFAIELDALKGTAGEQLSEAEKQLKAAKDQIEYLDKVLDVARQELNKLRDIESGIVSVASAINALATALKVEYNTNLAQQQKYLTGTGGAVFDKSTQSGTSSSGQYFTAEGLKSSFDAHIAAGGSLQQAVSVLSGSGFTLNQIEDMYGSTRGSLGAILDANGVARFAEGGAYQGGLAMVGEEGPELINFNKGGHVYTAPETQKIMGGGSNESEMRMLREEVSMLRNEARATALSTAKLNRNIERLIVPTAEGEALQTKTVA